MSAFVIVESTDDSGRDEVLEFFVEAGMFVLIRCDDDGRRVVEADCSMRNATLAPSPATEGDTK